MVPKVHTSKCINDLFSNLHHLLNGLNHALVVDILLVGIYMHLMDMGVSISISVSPNGTSA
jgi:hypothetical protein